MARPPPVTYRTNPLNERRFWTLNVNVFVGNNARRPLNHGQQFAGLQQKVGIIRPAELTVARGKCLINQNATRLQRCDQMSKQRAMQIIGYDNGVETIIFEWPWLVFQVCLSNNNIGSAS